MKYLVVVGDVHLHPHKAFAQGHGQHNSRFLSTLRNLENSLEKAKELQCPWICAGDFVHSIGFVQNFVLSELILLFNNFTDVQKWVVWGNHDARSTGGKVEASETIMGALAWAIQGKFFVLNEGYARSLNVTCNGLSITGRGYQPRVEDHSTNWDEKYDIGVFHQTIVGSKLPSGTKAEWGLPKELLLKSCTLSIVGDVHEPQIIGDLENGRYILIPGSLEAHNFGDKSERGWWIVKWKDSVEELSYLPELQFEMVPSQSPKFITVDTVDGVKKDGNFYRVLTPTDPSVLPSGVVSMAPPPLAIKQRDLPTNLDGRSLLSSWIETTPPDPQNSLSTREFLESGLGLLGADATVELKPIQLKNVHIQNFLCFKDVEFEIKDGITLVLGEGRDYESNGAGKTSLFESSYWCLFGRTTKGLSSDEVIQRGADTATVTLVLERAGEYVVRVRRTRVRGGGSNLEVFEDGGTGVWGGTQKEVTDHLKSYLGLTPELFQALAYFSQSKLVLFSQATDSERKEMLADLCGLDLYQNASAAARTASSRAEQEISKVSAALPSTEQLVQSHFAHVKNLQQRSELWEVGARGKSDLIRKELKLIEENFCSLDFRWQEFHEKSTLYLIRRQDEVLGTLSAVQEHWIASCSMDLQQAKHEFEVWKENAQYLPPLEIARQRKTDLKSQFDLVSKKTTTGRRNVDTLVRSIDSIRTKIKELRGQGPVCPACGQPVDTMKRDSLIVQLSQDESTVSTHLHFASTQQETLEKEWENLSSLSLVAEAEVRECEHYERERAAKEENLAAMHRLVTAGAIDSAKREVNERIVRIRSRMESRIRVLQKSVSSRHTWLQDRKEVLKRELEVLQQNPYSDDLQAGIKQLGVYTTQLSVLRQTKTALEKQKTLMDYWAIGFSRSGIQSLLIDGIAAAFNSVRGLVFPLLSNGIYDVQFSTVSETRAGDAREKTDFLIWDRSTLVSYESLSGGQRRRIDLGVMLALVLAVSLTRSVPGILGLLVLDEVTAFLDGDGVESLHQVLLEINKTIPSIFVITHDSSLQSLFERTLLVQQNEQGTSSLVSS